MLHILDTYVHLYVYSIIYLYVIVYRLIDDLHIHRHLHKYIRHTYVYYTQTLTPVSIYAQTINIFMCDCIDDIHIHRYLNKYITHTYVYFSRICILYRRVHTHTHTCLCDTKHPSEQRQRRVNSEIVCRLNLTHLSQLPHQEVCYPLSFLFQ